VERKAKDLRLLKELQAKEMEGCLKNGQFVILGQLKNVSKTGLKKMIEDLGG
jgi:hypothetical protein